MYIWDSWYFSWQSLSMIQRMLAIWSLVPLPFLNPACASGHSRFTCYWRMGPRWWSRRMCAHLLRELQNCTLLLNNHRQENVESHQKKLLWIQGQRRSPNKTIGIVKLWEIPVFKLDLEKAEEQEIKLPTSDGSSKKQESSRRTSISALLTMPKPLTVWITINCGKFWKRWEYQTTWPASWETCMQVKKQQLEMDMEQQTGSK